MDIRLSKMNNGGYDWAFENSDLEKVRGDLEIVNQVRHAVLLKKGESNLEAYKDMGCEAYNFIKEHRNTQTLEYISEAIRVAARSVNGVKDAIVTIDTDKQGICISNLKIIKEDNTEVNIGAI